MANSWVLMMALIASGEIGPGDHPRTLNLPGGDREYLVHVPASYNPSLPTPVLLALHPFATTAAMMARMSGLNATAEKEGFIVVYPEGTGIPALRNWNEGGMKGKTVDDVGFLRATLDDLASLLRIDPKRVYATGLSNGAMMCYRLASEMSDRIAAIAPVAGTMGFPKIEAARSVSVIHFHGTEDRLVPYDGPAPGVPVMSNFLSVQATMRAWAQANGCGETASVEDLPDKEKDDGTTVRVERWGPGREAAEVVLYTIVGGGHTWPGARASLPFLGKCTRDIDANALLWEFFKRHPMP